MVIGKDPRTYPATLEPGKKHALAVVALRRQPCPRVHGEIIGQICGKYAVYSKTNAT